MGDSHEFVEQIVARALDPTPFAGVALGHTLDNAIRFDLEARAGRAPRSKMEWARDVLRTAKWRLRPSYRSSATKASAGGRVVVAIAAAEQRCFDLVVPIISALGDAALAVTARLPRALNQSSVPASFVHASALMQYEHRAWRSEYERCSRAWGAVLDELIRSRTVPRIWRPRLKLELMVASQRVHGYRTYFATHRPRALVVDYDRDAGLSCMVLAARSLSIPTFTLVHGTPGRGGRGFVPLLADYALCWGEIDRDIFVEAGEDPARIIPVGCARLHPETVAVRSDEEPLEWISERGQAQVLLALSAHGRPQWRDVVAAFDFGVRQVPKLRGVVRLHPVDGDEVYAHIVRQHPNVVVRRSTDDRLADLIARSALVITDGSGVGGDAMVLGRSVVVLPGEASVTGHASVLTSIGACPLCRTGSDLAALLRRIESDREFRATLVQHRQRFAQSFCCATGNEAAQRSASAILARAIG